MLNIDNILSTDNVSIATRLTRYDVNFSECWGTLWHDESNIETDQVTQTDDSLTYEDLVLGLNPVHYYRLGEAADTDPANDQGSLNQDGDISVGTDVAQAGLLTGDLNGSISFGAGDNTAYVHIANFKIPCKDYTDTISYTGSPTDFSIEFIFRFDDSFTNESQVILGQCTDNLQGTMFGPVTLVNTAGKTYISYHYDLSDYSTFVDPTSNIHIYTEVQPDTTYHFVITNKNSTASIYKNGVLAATRTFSRGFFNTVNQPYVDETKPFRIGYADAFNDTGTVSTAFRLDEVAIYDTSLSAFDVNRHYRKMINGYQAVGGGTGDPPAEDTCDNRILPTLGAGTDVTQYVLSDSVTINRGDENLVDLLDFSCSESWGYNTLADVFRANTYLVVERRYATLDGTTDSGWLSIGHFLVEGPYGKEETSEGRKVYKISAKGLTKLLALDAPTQAFIEPDKLLVSRREMVDVSSGVEYKSFRVAREGVSGQFYENFSVFPTPKIWVTDFTAVPSIGGSDTVAPTDVIRAKGAEESVQFLYGTGTFRIDLDYFNAAVYDKGLGAPSTLQIEAYRHLTVDDIVRGLTITDLIHTTVGPDNIFAAIRVAKTEDAIISTETYVGRTVFLETGNAKGYMYKIISFTDEAPEWEFGVVAYQTNQGIPDLADDGVVVGDTITIGDANTVAQALTKVFLFVGFQNTDSTKPFYFEFVEPNFDGSVMLPPLKYKSSDSKTWINIVKDILEAATPNYVLYVDTAGVTRTKNVTQKTLGFEDHDLTKVVDFNIDGSDYGVITRIVAQGQFLDPIDVGLNINNGGGATYGAYKLTNFPLTWESELGSTLSQNDADVYIDQIANGDPKTPALWSGLTGSDRGYGAIWRVAGSTCHPWSMEDSDLFWIDLGKDSVSEREFLIDEFELQMFPPFFAVGTIIGQQFQIYHMTEDDYIAATGDIPPVASGDATVVTNMNGMATSPFWKPLTSEFNTPEGLTIVGSNEFGDGVPIRTRFIKFVCGQPWHHPRYNDDLYVAGISVIALSGLRIYTSTDIIQVAKLGFTPPFDTAVLRELAARLRQRTLYLEKNPYIQDVTQAKDFALQELKERYVEFEPIAISGIAPTADLWDTVKWTNPEDGSVATYVIKAISYQGNGLTNMHIIDFSYFQEA